MPGFGSPHPYSSSQLPITPVAGIKHTLEPLRTLGMHVVNIHAGKTQGKSLKSYSKSVTSVSISMLEGKVSLCQTREMQ